MNLDVLILYVIYATTIISIAFVPKNKRREASIAFLFQQFVSWFLGLFAVELNLIEYPIREFSRINGTSFLFEFLVYPMIGVFYCMYFPFNSTRWKKIIYTGAFSTSITIAEVIIEKYTDLAHYINWEWYWSWGSIFATLYLLSRFYKWYFKLGVN